MAEINYDAIRTEYLASDVTFASLAKKYGIDRTSISRKAKKDKWDEEKARLRIRAHEVVQEQTIDAQVSIADKCLSIVNIMVGKIAESAQMCDPSDTRTQKDIMAMVKDLNDMGAFSMEGSSERNTIKVELVGIDDEYGV